MALDFTVPTSGANFPVLPLQPGGTMDAGGHPSFAFAHPSCLSSPDPSKYPFVGVESTLAELTELRH